VTQTDVVGPQIAQGSVQQLTIAPTTLAELLATIQRKSGTQESMMHAVAARFVEFTGSAPEAIAIQTLYSSKEAFIESLRAGKYKAASVKSYRNYLNMLLRLAKDAGWVPTDLVVPSEWQVVMDVLKRTSVKKIIRFAVRIGRPPNRFSEEDLATWRKERVKAGRSQQDAEGDCSRLRSAIDRAGLSSHLPLIKPRDRRYGVPLADMHSDLRQEVQELLDWKLSDFQLDRPSGAQIRPISAKRLMDLISQITGYVQNIAKKGEINSLAAVMTQQHVAGFATWAKNTRKVKGQSLSTGLGMVFAALRHNPRYKEIDLSWFERIIDQLPVEPQSTIDQRKAKKYIPYSEAEQIPVRIRNQRAKSKRSNAKSVAISVRNELLMLWLVILPWRQRNIRECRVGGSNPNLFCATISPFCMATKSLWVAEQERASPGTKFWQIHFTPEETKTKNEVHAFLPSELVPLLEEYLSVHRPVLVSRLKDPVTLFLSTKGGGMNVGQMRNLVKGLASKYAGVPVTPHLYRDIVAFEWLSTHPEDYLTVSKLLWHRNISTTLKIYGRRFDESTGVARMDDWRAHRRATA
jgi:hypothetical protein